MEQNETKEERIAKLQAYRRDVDGELKKLQGDDADSPDVLARHNNRSDLAALFEKLSASEKAELRLTNPEKWAEMLEAVERHGFAKLYASN
jgi:hypothetical protein